MSWIESHQELAQHPKTRRLARLLGCGVPAAIGHLHMLWWWAVDYAPNGDLSRFEEADIADACMWDSDPMVFASSLKAAGFVDRDEAGGTHLHDWDEYMGRLIAQREANKERKRLARARQSDGRETAEAVPEESTAVTPLQNRTEHDLTGPDRTEPDTGSLRSLDAAKPLPRVRKRSITESDLASLEAEFPDVDVRALAEDYLNWSGSSKHGDKVLGLRNQFRDQWRLDKFRKVPLDGTAAFRAAAAQSPPPSVSGAYMTQHIREGSAPSLEEIRAMRAAREAAAAAEKEGVAT